MFRNEEDIKKLGQRPVNCLLTDGGLGDHIASLVVVNYIIKNYPYINLLVWVPDYLLDFAKHVIPGPVRSFTDAKQKFDATHVTISTRWDGRSTPMKMHLVDYAYHVLLDKHMSIEHKNYLKINPKKIDVKRFKLPENYAVMTTGFTAPNREFYAIHVNKIVDYLKAKGLEVVFLGKRNVKTGTKHIIQGNFSDEIDFPKGLNLVDKTNILEAAKIMNQSKVVIGLDNGLIHVAACTDVPIVGGFTNVDPQYRMPVRNNVLGWNFYPVVPDLACRFCQSNLSFIYDFDFKYCYYDDYQCLSKLSAELYIKELKKVLNER